MNKIDLTGPPTRAQLTMAMLAKAFSRQAGERLPDSHLRLEHWLPTKSWVDAYHQLVSWPHDAWLHPCLPQVAGFPLQMALLTDKAFPFPLLGLVHITNQIRQIRPLTLNSPWSYNATFADLNQSEKGWEFEILLHVYQDQQLCWQSNARYLSRVEVQKQAAPKKNGKNHQAIDVNALTEVAQFDVTADAGRRYASISGDYNPIHLYPLTARLFGFPKPIAHGMWTKAKVLSSVLENAGEFQLDCRFKQPVYLPTSVSLRRGQKGVYLSSQDKLHLEARID